MQVEHYKLERQVQLMAGVLDQLGVQQVRKNSLWVVYKCLVCGLCVSCVWSWCVCGGGGLWESAMRC